jgi:3-dehydroquinate synthase
MKIVHVPLKQHAYDIVIGCNILSLLGAKLKSLQVGRDAVVITNPMIQRCHGPKLTEGLKKSGFSVKVFEVTEGEVAKSAKSAFAVMEKIARYDCLKNIFVVAFGGGVVGDLAGYVAAVYKRGVPYVQVPTTLLAQIDSAIGGKVAIDLPVGKNLIGAFYQPRIVWSDVSVLSTLSQRQVRNGLAEAVKYGVICDKTLFTYIARNYNKLLERDAAALGHVVLRCSQIKSRIVSQDEKEAKGIRTVLNFGHTAGHAIEAAGRYAMCHHGEAIALGMRVAAEISCRLRMLCPEEACILNGLLSDIGLPRKIAKLRMADILRAMRHDKKFIAGRHRFVLAQKIGRVKVVEDVPLSVIQGSIRAYM